MKTRMMSQFNEFNRISFPQCLWGLTMAMIMATVLAQSQGRVWQGTCLMAEKRRRMETSTITTLTEKREMSRLEITSPSRMPPMSRDEVLRYLISTR